jgi:hypothetical protein
LIEWYDDEVDVRLLHGLSGMGKTRLGIELVERLRGRSWDAGLLPGEAEHAPEEAFSDRVAGNQPLLVVIDYAETREQVLVRLLKIAHRHRLPKLRILLLARSPGSWWERLKWVNAEAQELTATAQAEELRPIPDQDCARRAFFYAATKAFARWMDKVCDKDYPRRAFSDPATKAFAPRLGRSYADRTALDLADPEFGQPLFIAMAALAALAGQTIDAAEKALQWVLQRERRQWERRHSQEGLKRYQDLFAQAAALAVMVGGSENVPGLRRLAADVPLAQGVAVPDLDAVARILAELYPERGHLGVLRPSLLGEELALAELEREPGLVAAAFADARTPEQLVHAFTILARAASRRPKRAHLIEQALACDGKRVPVPALQAATRFRFGACPRAACAWIVRALGRSQEAVSRFEETLPSLLLLAGQRPQPYRAGLQTVVRDDRDACAKSGRSPEQRLLEEADRIRGGLAQRRSARGLRSWLRRPWRRRRAVRNRSAAAWRALPPPRD